MFCNLTANAVRGALLNLAKTADLEQDIAELECGKRVADSASDCWTSIGRKTGD